ncbi:MAG: hypothetical protein ACTTK0_05820 [Stomatobaculum sp.]
MIIVTTIAVAVLSLLSLSFIHYHGSHSTLTLNFFITAAAK